MAALRDFIPLAARGHDAASYEIAGMYKKGKGFPLVYTRALEWQHNAAENGHKKSRLLIGSWYNNGRRTPKDSIAAYMWYNLAAIGGEKLGNHYRDSMAKRLTQEEIDEGRRRSAAWLDKFGNASQDQVGK